MNTLNSHVVKNSEFMPHLTQIFSSSIPQVATSRIVERFNEYLMNLVKMTSDYLTNIVDVLITLVLTFSLSPLFERRCLAFMSGTLLFTSPTCLQII